VQFDLKEGRVSARNASLYAINSDTTDFANKINWLLDNEDARREMGEYGYQRILHELSWDYEKNKLIDFYKKVLRTEPVPEPERKLKASPTYLS
jgi:glycosyltransferase involved in cell wall biosynthesis